MLILACYHPSCISNACLARLPRALIEDSDRVGKVLLLSNLRPLSFSRLTIIHRPAPTLSGLLPTALSPLAATLMDLPASVAYKRLTAWLNPLDAIFKNRGATTGPPTRPPTPRRSNVWY